MKTLTVGDLKTNFSEVLKEVQNGAEIAITFGKKKKVVAFLVQKLSKNPQKRILGQWSSKGKVTFGDDFEITEEEFLGL
jgi:antitoxin (DNA-binding transcriptional repressor) of toxin-antitoxin stability system